MTAVTPDAAVDRRKWVPVHPYAVHVRVPYSDYRSGRTIAWMRRRVVDQQWEVRVLGGPHAGGYLYNSEHAAATQLEMFTRAEGHR